MSDEARLLTYCDAIREATQQEMDRDASVFLFGLDVDDHKAIQGSTRGMLERFGKDRVFTTPLSEDAMTGIAIGSAMAGMRPIHVHIRMDFMLLCMNQLINVGAKSRYMYGGQTQIPLVVRSMIGKSWGQGAQHSQGLYPLFMNIPGLKVVAPSNAYDAKGTLIASIRDNNPVVFMEHRLLYFTDAYVPEESYEVPLGKARVCAEGTDITLVGISNMVMECLRARELLADVGISAEVIDPVTLHPLDSDTIKTSVRKTGRILTVDNGWTNCGAGAEILARISEDDDLDHVRARRMGFAPTTCPTSPWLEKEFYPGAASIASKAALMVDGRNWSPNEEKAQLSYQITFRGPF